MCNALRRPAQICKSCCGLMSKQVISAPGSTLRSWVSLSCTTDVKGRMLHSACSLITSATIFILSSLWDIVNLVYTLSSPLCENITKFLQPPLPMSIFLQTNMDIDKVRSYRQFIKICAGGNSGHWNAQSLALRSTILLVLGLK